MHRSSYWAKWNIGTQWGDVTDARWYGYTGKALNVSEKIYFTSACHFDVSISPLSIRCKLFLSGKLGIPN